MSSELKPCPFCGDRAAFGHTRYSKPLSDTQWVDGSPVTETHHVNCIACLSSTSGSSHIGGSRTKEEAAEKWNRRVSPAAEEALEWLGKNRLILDCTLGDLVRDERRVIAEGSTPLEAIRNAMKGESDD